MLLFEKEYDSESLGQDIERDIYEAMNANYNPVFEKIPQDSSRFEVGKFTVTITWENE